MTYLIIILILVFGCALTGIGVRLIYGQRRIERRVAVTEAAIRATLGPPPPDAGDGDAEGPDRRHGLVLVPPMAVLAGVALMLRAHWRAVSGVAGGLAAAAVVLGLILGHTPPASAGPPMAGQPTAAVLTGATSPAAPSTAPSSSRPAPVASTPSAAAPAPSSVVVEPVVLTGEAPARPQPIVAPSSSTPVPSRSPSAPSHPPHLPVPSPPGSSAACLLTVNASPILAVCLL